MQAMGLVRPRSVKSSGSAAAAADDSDSDSGDMENRQPAAAARVVVSGGVDLDPSKMSSALQMGVKTVSLMRLVCRMASYVVPHSAVCGGMPCDA